MSWKKAARRCRNQRLSTALLRCRTANKNCWLTCCLNRNQTDSTPRWWGDLASAETCFSGTRTISKRQRRFSQYSSLNTMPHIDPFVFQRNIYLSFHLNGAPADETSHLFSIRTWQGRAPCDPSDATAMAILSSHFQYTAYRVTALEDMT